MVIIQLGTGIRSTAQSKPGDGAWSGTTPNCNAECIESTYLSLVSYYGRPSTVHSSLENVCRLISNTACECHEWFLMAIYLARRVFCTTACNNWSFRETDAKQEREITCMRAFKDRITRRIVEICLGLWPEERLVLHWETGNYEVMMAPALHLRTLALHRDACSSLPLSVCPCKVARLLREPLLLDSDPCLPM